MPTSGVPPRRRWRSVLPVCLFAALAVLGPWPHHAGPVASGVLAAGTGVRARTTWNGADVGSAATPQSALAVSLGSTVDVRYWWNATAVGAASAPQPITVGTARLEMFYFGLGLSTRDEVETNPTPALNGTFDLQWDPGILRWLLAGSYQLTASLLTPNGTTVWSESFYIDAEAPFVVGAILPIVLIAIAAYEVYCVAVSGRHDRPAATRTATVAGSKGKPPAVPPASEPTEPEEAA